MGKQIDRREFIRETTAGVAAGVLPLHRMAWAAENQPQQRPNILLIMTDQEPISAVGCYGNRVVKTPARDALAAGGVRFDNFYIASFPCSPSRATMITGRYAHNHGVVINEVLLDESIPSLGNTLGRAGYDTAWIGKWHLGGCTQRPVRGRPFKGRFYYQRVESPDGFTFEPAEGGTGEDEPRSGFAHWVGGWKHFKQYLKTTNLPDKIRNNKGAGNHNALPSGPDSEHAYSLLGEDHHMAHFFADETVKFLNGAKGSGRPFCAVLSFFGPHLPVCPPKPWDTMYPLDQVTLPPNHHASMEGKPFKQRSGDRTFVAPRWSPQQFQDYISRYWGYVSYIDRQIQRVLAALKANGQEDNTIVVFTSDHGDMVGQHGSIYKLTHNAYDTLMKVPCMIRWPARIKPGQVHTSLASNVDLMPTLLDLAGVTVPDGVDGRSMKRVLLGHERTVRDEVYLDVMNRGVMIRSGTWKYVLNWRQIHPTGRERDELYDLATDPHEMHNLAYVAEHKPRAAEMQQRIFRWLTETGHPYADVIRKAAAKPVAKPFGLKARVAGFEDRGDGNFCLDVEWICSGPCKPLAGAVGIVQLVLPRRGARKAQKVWQEQFELNPTADTWKPGARYRFQIEGRVTRGIPKDVYTVAVGIDCPGVKGGVMLATGHRRSMAVGQMKVEHTANATTLSVVAYRNI
jgi:arylsulfatase A-like enzyme